MLPAENRLRRAEDFRRTLRSGRSARCGPVTVHLDGGQAGGPPRVGLVVGRAVGPSVTRHRVQRRLRHLLRARLALLPAGSTLVVRAAPPAAAAASGELAADLDAALTRVLAPVGESVR